MNLETSKSLGESVTLPVGKHRWLMGMKWRSYDDAPDKDQLKAEVESLGAKWVATRLSDEVIQLGFSEGISGDRSKVYSLAALLADSYKHPWAGSFDLGEGAWWYIAVRDNYSIMPSGDLVGTKEQIEDQRARHASEDEYNHVVGDLSDLESLIEDSKGKKTQVSKLDVKAKVPYTFILVVSALLAGGFYAYHLKIESAALRQREISLRNALSNRGPSVDQNLAHLTAGLPGPREWMRACSSFIRQPVSPSVDGWLLTGFDCDGSRGVLTWQRGEGADIGSRPEGMLSTDGNTIISQHALYSNSVFSSDYGILAKSKEKLTYWSQLHHIPVIMTVSKVDKRKGVLVPSVNFTFSTASDPFSLNLDGIPGLRVTRAYIKNIYDDPTSGIGGLDPWKVSGVIYGK